MSKSTIARKADLATAFKRFKKGEQISLEDLARLWGVTKARFINIRNDIQDFPDPVGKQGNAHLYEAKAAIAALIRHESRNDAQVNAKSAKVARILGATVHAAEEEGALPAAEMLALARARAEIAKRLQEQGTLVKFSDVQQTAAEVFGEISQVLGKLSDSVDPNGKLSGQVRAIMDDLGKDLLLRMYNKLDDMLTDDVDSHTHRATPARKRTHRPRRTKVRSKAA
jgi:hypothetical protein